MRAAFLSRAMRRAGDCPPYLVGPATGVLNATRVLSGEILRPGAVRNSFECVRSTSATKIFPLRSYAILRCAALTRAEKATLRKTNNEVFQAPGALTLGKRAFLIKRFGFFPSVDIR